MVSTEERYKVLLREAGRSRLVYGIGYPDIGPKVMEFIRESINNDERPTPEWAYRVERSDWMQAAREFNEWCGYEAIEWEEL